MTNDAANRAAKKYYEANKERILAKAKLRYAEKAQIQSIQTPEQRAENQRARSKEYYRKNREIVLAKRKEHFPRAYNRSASNSIRTLIRKAMLNESTRGRTSKVVLALGCSLDDFRAYVAGKFTKGMTWENYGSWHLDHIKSLSKFDLRDPEQYAEACHYTNYQPLWAIDNRKKGAS